MAISRVVPIVRVKDIGLAIDFYRSKLGFVTDFHYSAGPDGPWYAGLSRDGNQIHLSTFSGDGVPGTAVYCYVDDVDALFERFRQAGLKTPGRPESPVDEGPVDQTWGMREVYVRDPDGNTLRFGSPSPRRDATR
jgi:catechol 2,3-dioxygenase-like lactoylglutathione lyase family enzyme